MELFKSRTRVAYTNAVGDKVYPVIVDIKRGIKSTEEIQFMSSDINTGILSVAFIQGNDNYNVTGADVVCSVMRPDASTLELPCEVVSENIVEVPLGINGTSQDGIYSFDFKVLKGGNKIVGTPIMNYSVSLSIGNDMVVEEDDRLPVLTMLMTQLTELKGEARETINQANAATVASREATANAIEATTNANAVSERVSQETSEVISRVDNKVNEVETRFNALTTSQQQDAEVIDARDGEISLKARLDRDIEKAKQVYVNVEGSHISTDSSVGYLKDVEILGNTIQSASNLADIRSVGDKVEGQELYEIPVLSRGKNLFDGVYIERGINGVNGEISTALNRLATKNFVRCKANTSYTIKINGGNFETREMYYYNTDGSFIGVIPNSAFKTLFTFTPTKDVLIRWQIRKSDDSNVTLSSLLGITTQLEEGTVATPYEPYQEDKLTILSPVQLEKVGDVRDRIICKDGVWGVEKNTIRKSLTASSVAHNGTVNGLTEYIIDTLENSDTTITSNVICNKLVNKFSTTEECCFVTKNQFRVRILTNKYPNTESIKTEVINNKWYIIYKSAQPQFIPLPHSQQIKLRTFANKTNISFLTEIEGTIKAQVPKSLGATVNTHTEQIHSLNNELNRVKKLEESTVSTVTTESDFTTVEATSNGYFEDVKLEGKTLVNCIKLNGDWFDTETTLEASSTNYVGLSNYTKGWDLSLLKDNTTYTVIPFVDYTVVTQGEIYIQLNTEINGVSNSLFRIYENMFNKPSLITTKELTNKNSKSLFIGGKNCSYKVRSVKILILEGDHTQNPPSYFEGLKSVGQSATTSEDDVDEIVVSSVNKGADITFSYTGHANFKIEHRLKTRLQTNFTIFNPHSNKVTVCVFKNGNWFRDVLVEFGCKYIELNEGESVDYLVQKYEDGWTSADADKINDLFVVTQSDKKRLLYYNTETQAWEKPILREWDSIEKHSDGKYYYHQRSGEIALNGSEDTWGDATSSFNLPTTNSYHVKINDYIQKPKSIVCDKFISDITRNEDVQGIYHADSYVGANRLVFRVYKDTHSTLAGFKQWLQTNNVTVVYQLAQEKVYECTNIDLITYANETNYIVECGAIVPKSTLKVHNNISNVVKILQEKVSLLESNVKASQEVQDMMILETDMRMLDIELALMEFVPMKLNLGGSDMLRSATYFNFLKNHIVNETYEKEYLENVMNKYLATGRINQDEYDELYKMLYPPVYDIELPIEP